MRLVVIAVGAISVAAMEIALYGLVSLLRPVIGEKRVRSIKSYIMVRVFGGDVTSRAFTCALSDFS